ncbi:alpha/beta-hydrolase [Ophiobolus disseminans]|uniref:Alpha/beta-hydrolase n=1 Tax=Ophiobolus disseminans TaxID=1469910 RepID=A0A6A6ZRD7_9PLEO|nr:alpha/beta-hydrolase [Ophiobolus disseminans]
MSHHNSKILVLPRPGAALTSPQPPVSGPSEEAFTQVFGKLLPPAQYIHTQHGKAAYYEKSPSSPSSTNASPDRVLFIHGVQTPALGLFPLARALHETFTASHFVLLDLWGHGLSDTPIVPHEPALFHGLIDALLDYLNWPTAHLVGFSFGGALTVGYLATRPERVSSHALIAPAGLIHFDAFSPEQQALLRGGGDEVAAQACVLDILEGGPIEVPSDWKERVARGEVVAKAVKEWQMREHAGHAASVVAVFRDGGVMDRDEEFVKAAGSGVPNVVVLGGEDDLCTKEQLGELGFRDVRVVEGAGHELVRENVPEVTKYIAKFWYELSSDI